MQTTTRPVPPGTWLPLVMYKLESNGCDQCDLPTRSVGKWLGISRWAGLIHERTSPLAHPLLSKPSLPIPLARDEWSYSSPRRPPARGAVLAIELAFRLLSWPHQVIYAQTFVKLIGDAWCSLTNKSGQQTVIGNRTSSKDKSCRTCKRWVRKNRAIWIVLKSLTKEAKYLFGTGANILDGVTVRPSVFRFLLQDWTHCHSVSRQWSATIVSLCCARPSYQLIHSLTHHHHHWSAELWFDFWRTYSSLDPRITPSG
jgi:hypothetical protein